jgi:hypothetical protein
MHEVPGVSPKIIHTRHEFGSPCSRESANDALAGCEMLDLVNYFFHNTRELMALQVSNCEYLRYRIKDCVPLP